MATSVLESEIIQGDCLEVMKTFPDNHFSAIVTDPPYGLHFMGKDWDHGIPGVAFWKEALRIAKPGAHLLSFGGTRTYHRLACALEDSGFEIRDCLMWIYGSGFPKSHNHFGIEGFGTALKPAYEPIIMAMKPLDETFKQNAEKWGQAGINIDGSRIGLTGIKWSPRGKSVSYAPNSFDKSRRGEVNIGRWPANVIFDEEAAKMLDEQTKGTRAEKASCIGKVNNGTAIWGNGKPRDVKESGYYCDFGGASRFFYCAKASSRERNEGLDGFPDKVAFDNPSGSMGKNMGSRSGPRKNNHPTVKPLKLMEYLIKLVMPPSNGLLLDPFAGSGTTILAAKRLGFDAIGIEKQPDYVELAKARLSHQNELEKDKQIDFLQNIS